MREQLSFLYELQRIDVQIFGLEEEKRGLPAKLTKLNGQLDNLGTEIQGLDGSAAGLEHEAKALESNVQAEKLKLRKWEARLKEIRNQREYLALSREIEGTKRAIGDSEEKILELWKSRETLEEEVDGLRDRTTEVGVAATDETGRLEMRLGEISGCIEKHASRRKYILPRVDKTLLRRYDRIRAKRRGVGLAIVMGGTCQSCNVALRPQMYNQLQRGEEILECASCQRILIWQQHLPNLSDERAAEIAAAEATESSDSNAPL